jgi:hypothetical protein
MRKVHKAEYLWMDGDRTCSLQVGRASEGVFVSYVTFFQGDEVILHKELSEQEMDSLIGEYYKDSKLVFSSLERALAERNSNNDNGR